VTSSVGHERAKRSTAGEHHVVSMTAENMIPTHDDDDDDDVHKPTRIKRDLKNYLYNRRWINDSKSYRAT